MLKRNSSKQQNKACPHCGGMHAPGQCPMFMVPAMPPMMPPMAPPMFSPIMPPMEGGMMGGEMMMPGMHEMHQMMMEHHQMLEHIQQRVDEIYDIVRSMQTGYAKG